MNRRLNVLALVGALSLLSCTANAGEQNQARADIKNAEGKSVGTASFRKTADGVLMTINIEGLPGGLMPFMSIRLGGVKGPPLQVPAPILIQ